MTDQERAMVERWHRDGTYQTRLWTALNRGLAPTPTPVLY